MKSTKIAKTKYTVAPKLSYYYESLNRIKTASAATFLTIK